MKRSEYKNICSLAAVYKSHVDYLNKIRRQNPILASSSYTLALIPLRTVSSMSVIALRVRQLLSILLTVNNSQSKIVITDDPYAVTSFPGLENLYLQIRNPSGKISSFHSLDDVRLSDASIVFSVSPQTRKHDRS